MSWMGKILGGAFGFMLGGPLGAILGAAAGHQFDSGLDGIELGERLNPGDQQRIQMAFFTATFSVMGHIAKADGRVTPSEIKMAEQVMAQMGLDTAMRETAIQLFRQGKQADFPIENVLEQFLSECRGRKNLLRMFIEIQLQAAFADGQLNRSEEAVLLRICDYLHFSRFEYEAIKMQFQAQQRFYQYSQQQGYGSRYQRQDNLTDAYAVLGVKPTATDAEVKKAYRKLMSQHHPDKLVAKGLPEEMMKLAKEKTQQIRKAYETIRAARGSK